MRKFIIALLLLIFLIGCQSQTRDERANVNWRTGSMGLNMRFLPDLPPPRVYDDSELTVVLEVNNAGATLYNSLGSIQFVTFQATPTKLSARSIPFIPVTLLATACYNYQTIATENVCVDLDPFSPNVRDKVCQSTAVSSGTQGAPIAVTSVQIDPSPGRTKFTIMISNVGNGNPFPPGPVNMQKCSPYDPQRIPLNDIDMIRVNDVQISGRSILPECNGLTQGNLIRLINGQGKIFCDFRDARTTPAYVSPLIISLEYGYKTSILTSLQLIASD